MKHKTNTIPWGIKILAKIVLSRLPIRYSLWRKLNIFLHGSMKKPEYAYSVFQTHFERCNFARKKDKFVCLELGPGDSLLSAIIAKAHGSGKCYLVDAGPYASKEMASYREMISFLNSRGLLTLVIGADSDVASILKDCNASYLTQGLKSLQSIPSASIDFLWSQAVLEHIRRNEFLETMCELRRVMRPEGICSHRVELKDHLDGGLNNLRFPTKIWESNWMSKSGFYTNRLRFSEITNLFKQAGFDIEIVTVNRWSSKPITRGLMANEFQSLSEDDLLVKEFDILLRPSAESLTLKIE